MSKKRIDILIVDDNQFYRKGLILMLKRICNVGGIIEASNGIECLELLKNNSPDIILMDIKMPEMDGIAATQKVLEINHHLKIIALTMYVNKEYLMEMILVGAKGFLLKDSNDDEIRYAIEKVLDGGNYYAKKALEQMNLAEYR